MNAKTKKRLFSGGVGAALFVIAIIFQDVFPRRTTQVQIAVWSLTILAMMILGNYEHYRKKWFWRGLAAGLLLHICVVYSFRQSLPFSSLGIVILMSVPEAVVLQMIFRALSVDG